MKHPSHCLASFAAAWLLAAPAGAQSAPPSPPRKEHDRHDVAWRYAHGSVSLLASGAISAATDQSPGLGEARVTTSVSARARLIASSGLVLEPRIVTAIGTQSSQGASGGNASASANLSLGGAVGYAVAIGPSVALTPMLGYQFTAFGDLFDPIATGLGSAPVFHTLDLQLPITIFLSRHVFLEVQSRVYAMTSFQSDLTLGCSVATAFGVTF